MYVLWRWLSQVSRNSLNLHHECKQKSAKHSWQMNLDFFFGGGSETFRESKLSHQLIFVHYEFDTISVAFFSPAFMNVTSSTRAFPEVKNFVCPNSLQRGLSPFSFSLHVCLVASPLSKFKKTNKLVGSSNVTSALDVYNGGGYACVKAGCLWEISPPSS